MRLFSGASKPCGRSLSALRRGAVVATDVKAHVAGVPDLVQVRIDSFEQTKLSRDGHALNAIGTTQTLHLCFALPICERWQRQCCWVADSVCFLVNFYGFTALLPWFAEARNWISIFAHIVFGVVLGWLHAVCTRRAMALPANN